MNENNSFQKEIKQGQRFEFGKNWQRFLSVVNEERILEAEKSLKKALSIENLKERTFLDVGCGSGLFSLAASRLGAKVYSFDYDPNSVACTKELKRRYFPHQSDWIIEEGSILDRTYLKSLGIFDIVYSWGVLHHTGAMWQAIENITDCVRDGGKLYISIYNDQGEQSIRWREIKKFYCSSWLGKILVTARFVPMFFWELLVFDFKAKRNPFLRYQEYKKQRGMSMFYDWIDWLGGYPFEVSKPEKVIGFYQERGFILKDLFDCGEGLGCNQFLFVKSRSDS